MTKITMKLDSEKKHSVLYKPLDSEKSPPLTSIYVMKHALKLPYPEHINVTIEDSSDG